MVSRRCGLHSMVVYSYYIQRTGPRGINTTINTSDIHEEYMFISFKSLILYLLLQDEPMGAVSVFYVLRTTSTNLSVMFTALRVVAASVVFA